MAVVKVACKVGAGVDLSLLSDYLNDVKAGIGEELADSALSGEALRSVVQGDEAASATMLTESRSSYAALQAFLDKEEHKQKANPTAGYVDFKDEMKRVGDGHNSKGVSKSGVVWVSNANAPLWEASVPKCP